MISMKKLAMGAALALSLVGASSASAANWDPAGTNVTATQESPNGKLTVAGGLAVTCTGGDATLNASTNVAMTVGALGFTGCTDPLGTAASVTTFGTWNFVATDTTNVDANVLGPGAGGTGSVATIHLPILGCTITVQGPVNIANNDWNNTNHTLTINGAAKFPIIPSTESCQTLVGTTGSIDASYQLPSTVIIT